MKKFLVLAGVVVGGAASANITIDDFTTPYFNSIIGGTWVDFQAGAMASGERDVEMAVLANPLLQFMDVAITGGGLAITSNGFGLQSTISLQYDVIGDEVGNTGANKVLTNAGSGVPLLPGFNDRIRIHFLGNDLNVNLAVELRLNGGLIAVGNGARAAGQGAGFEDIAFAPAALAVADSITVRMTADPSGDFAISKIEGVPEPGSVLALGLGLAAIAARRRRKA